MLVKTYPDRIVALQTPRKVLWTEPNTSVAANGFEIGR